MVKPVIGFIPMAQLPGDVGQAIQLFLEEINHLMALAAGELPSNTNPEFNVVRTAASAAAAATAAAAFGSIVCCGAAGMGPALPSRYKWTHEFIRDWTNPGGNVVPSSGDGQDASDSSSLEFGILSTPRSAEGVSDKVEAGSLDTNGNESGGDGISVNSTNVSLNCNNENSSLTLSGEDSDGAKNNKVSLADASQVVGLDALLGNTTSKNSGPVGPSRATRFLNDILSPAFRIRTLASSPYHNPMHSYKMYSISIQNAYFPPSFGSFIVTAESLPTKPVKRLRRRDMRAAARVDHSVKMAPNGTRMLLNDFDKRRRKKETAARLERLVAAPDKRQAQEIATTSSEQTDCGGDTNEAWLQDFVELQEAAAVELNPERSTDAAASVSSENKQEGFNADVPGETSQIDLGRNVRARDVNAADVPQQPAKKQRHGSPRLQENYLYERLAADTLPFSQKDKRRLVHLYRMFINPGGPPRGVAFWDEQEVGSVEQDTAAAAATTTPTSFGDSGPCKSRSSDTEVENILDHDLEQIVAASYVEGPDEGQVNGANDSISGSGYDCTLERSHSRTAATKATSEDGSASDWDTILVETSGGGKEPCQDAAASSSSVLCGADEQQQLLFALLSAPLCRADSRSEDSCGLTFTSLDNEGSGVSNFAPDAVAAILLGARAAETPETSPKEICTRATPAVAASDGPHQPQSSRKRRLSLGSECHEIGMDDRKNGTADNQDQPEEDYDEEDASEDTVDEDQHEADLDIWPPHPWKRSRIDEDSIKREATPESPAEAATATSLSSSERRFAPSEPARLAKDASSDGCCNWKSQWHDPTSPDPVAGAATVYRARSNSHQEVKCMKGGLLASCLSEACTRSEDSDDGGDGYQSPSSSDRWHDASTGESNAGDGVRGTIDSFNSGGETGRQHTGGSSSLDSWSDCEKHNFLDIKLQQQQASAASAGGGGGTNKTNHRGSSGGHEVDNASMIETQQRHRPDRKLETAGNNIRATIHSEPAGRSSSDSGRSNDVVTKQQLRELVGQNRPQKLAEQKSAAQASKAHPTSLHQVFSDLVRDIPIIKNACRRHETGAAKLASVDLGSLRDRIKRKRELRALREQRARSLLRNPDDDTGVVARAPPSSN